MARKIIVLDQQGLPSDANYRVVYWLDVPVARRPYYANATTTTQVTVGPNAATQAEIDALKAGTVYEVAEVMSRPAGASDAQLATAAIARFNALQTAMNNQNPWSKYGTSWDGSAWTTITVA